MVEIKELVVRANVGGNDSSSVNVEKAIISNSYTGNDANYDIIEACVRQVLAILERKKER